MSLFNIIIFQLKIPITLSDILTFAFLIISTITAYHIYRLNKRLSFSNKMVNKEHIQGKVYRQLTKIRNGIRSTVELINLRRYEKDYPQKNQVSQRGYTYLAAGLKDVRYDGVEFFDGMPLAAYFDDKSELTIKKLRIRQN